MKNLKRAIQLATIAMLGGVSLGAMAGTMYGPDGYAYLGAGIGYGRMNGEDFTNNNDDLTKSHVSWKAMAGAKLNGVLAVEGQYIDFGAANRNSDRIQATGWTADVVVDLMENASITPYAKVGALFWNTDNRFNNISRREDGTNLTFGLGARFMLADNLALRTEYERFMMDHTDIDNFSAALQLSF